jgi:organic radical activating enzyme
MYVFCSKKAGTGPTDPLEKRYLSCNSSAVGVDATGGEPVDGLQHLADVLHRLLRQRLQVQLGVQVDLVMIWSRFGETVSAKVLQTKTLKCNFIKIPTAV